MQKSLEIEAVEKSFKHYRDVCAEIIKEIKQ